jgi:hypothetical protein
VYPWLSPALGSRRRVAPQPSPVTLPQRRVRRVCHSQRRVRELLSLLERSEAQLLLLDTFEHRRGGVTLDGSIGMAATVIAKNLRSPHLDTTQRTQLLGWMARKRGNRQLAQVLPRRLLLHQITKTPMGSTHPPHPRNLRNPLRLSPHHRLPSPNPPFPKTIPRSWLYPSHDALSSPDFTRQWSFATQRSSQRSRK